MPDKKITITRKEELTMEMKEILKHVDHTLLLQPSTWEEIKQICDNAMKYGTAYCVHSTKLCKRSSRVYGW